MMAYRQENKPQGSVAVPAPEKTALRAEASTPTTSSKPSRVAAGAIKRAGTMFNLAEVHKSHNYYGLSARIARNALTYLDRHPGTGTEEQRRTLGRIQDASARLAFASLIDRTYIPHTIYKVGFLPKPRYRAAARVALKNGLVQTQGDECILDPALKREVLQSFEQLLSERSNGSARYRKADKLISASNEYGLIDSKEFAEPVLNVFEGLLSLEIAWPYAKKYDKHEEKEPGPGPLSNLLDTIGYVLERMLYPRYLNMMTGIPGGYGVVEQAEAGRLMKRYKERLSISDEDVIAAVLASYISLYKKDLEKLAAMMADKYERKYVLPKGYFESKLNDTKSEMRQ